MAVPVETNPAFRAGTPTELFDGPYQVDLAGHPSYDVSPDRERFLMIEPGGARRVEVVLNWFEELRARVPTGQ